MLSSLKKYNNLFQFNIYKFIMISNTRLNI